MVGSTSWAAGLPIAAVVTGVVALVLSLGSLVPSDFPWLAYAWGFAFVLAVWVAATGWSGAGRWRRVVAVAVVVLTLLAALDTVDEQSGSFPTVGRLVTFDPENVVEIPQLQQIRAQVAATGKLPGQGVVVTVTIPPKVSHFATRPAYVYLPPVWFSKVTPSLPTLILLPGEPGSAADWSGDGDADNTADAFAQAHHGLAPIIVMPDPNGLLTVDSECVNSKFGNAETYLVQDVPAFAGSQFNASDRPGSLAVGGLSAGGTCSVMLSLRHPTVFPTFASFSGFATPQYQETTQADTIDILFGGSETGLCRPRPGATPPRWPLRRPGRLVRGGRSRPRATRGRPQPAAGGPSGRHRHLHSGAARRARLRPVEPGARGLVPLAFVATRAYAAALAASRQGARRHEARRPIPGWSCVPGSCWTRMTGGGWS